MKSLLCALFTAACFAATVRPVLGIVDPRSTPNNRFGIHIISEEDLEDAAALVNSAGGGWGYVTIVIREDDRNVEKWQRIFDRMRELKLIPLLRLATKAQDGGWAKPREEDIDSWVSFLSSLNWVVKNRYVILFNEPNHAKEWGGSLDPEEYARFTRFFHDALKKRSEDFFVLPAGFDAAATNGPETMTPEAYWLKMRQEDPTVFSLFDGWTSHAYPNPNFSGSLNQKGKTSLQGYRWEIGWLKRYGLKSDIPVIITETGWIHREGKVKDPSAHSADTVAALFKQAYQSIWLDSQIIAVTPFVLRYPEEPFDHFSWMKEDSEKYQQYDEVKAIPKTNGEPPQVHSGIFLPPSLPEELVVDSDYTFTIRLKNIGQSIWNRDDFSLKVENSEKTANIFVGHIPETDPFRIGEVEVRIRTPKETGNLTLTIELLHKGKPFGETREHKITILPPPSIILKADLWIKPKTSAGDFTLLIYDEGKLVKKIEPFSIKNGVGTVSELHDVIPEKVYRFVLTKPYYLPRQMYAYLSQETTTVEFKRLLPLDFNSDGTLTLRDIVSFFRYPQQSLRLLSPF